MNASKTARAAIVLAAATLTSIAISLQVRADDTIKPDTVITTVGDQKITEKDLETATKPIEANMRSMLEARVDSLMKERQEEIRKETLESLTDQKLIAIAAKKANQKPDDYVKDQTTGKNATTDADARKYYNEHKTPQSPPYDQIKDKLIPSLSQQAMIDRLKKEYPVKMLLEPTRVSVNYEGHPSLGPATAPVTMVEFSDFQCPFCKRTEPTIKELRAKYGDKIRLVYLDFPLSFHNHSLDAAKAGRCANEQGKFWEMHDAMFADQAKL